MLTPVVPVLTDSAPAILAVAEALQPDLAQGCQIDALRLRLKLERAFSGSDADGAWAWKLAYEVGEVALVKRNDAMLDVLPVGVLVLQRNGIQENLADRAKKFGAPVLKFEKGA